MWIHSKRSNNFCDFFTYFASMEKQIIECVPTLVKAGTEYNKRNHESNRKC